MRTFDGAALDAKDQVSVSIQSLRLFLPTQEICASVAK